MLIWVPTAGVAAARPDVATVGDLPGLLPGADVVVLLGPVTPETIGMADGSY